MPVLEGALNSKTARAARSKFGSLQSHGAEMKIGLGNSGLITLTGASPSANANCPSRLATQICNQALCIALNG